MNLDPRKALQIPSTVYLGCDPEFFFSRAGKVIGAEKVLTTSILSERWNDMSAAPVATDAKPFVIDGVQVELNPRPHTCRANLSSEIGSAFRALKAHLEKMKDVTASFSAVVTVEKEELDSLSDKARVFGCAPSLNAYDSSATVGVDASTYLKRSAGGHIHIGLDKNEGLARVMKERKRLVPLLDILLGNTFVLLDRDPEAVERRKVYGRAGEFREPAHGLEYRTLSNVWLRACPLMSLAMALTKLSVGVLYTSFWKGVSPDQERLEWDAEQELLALVPVEKAQEAINGNDLGLARENFQAVERFLQAHYQHGIGLYAANLPAFKRFLADVDSKGLEGVFPEDPLDHWCGVQNGHGRGWESLLIGQYGGTY